MKKLAVCVAVALTVFALPAFAAVPAAVVSAVSSGNIASLNAAAAANPQDQGDIAVYIMQQAQQRLSTNPSRAADLFAAASPFLSQTNATQTGMAVTVIRDFADEAESPSFQSANPSATSKIFSAAISMTSQPNVLAVAPTLRGGIVTAANEYLDSAPGENEQLRDEVLLAQAPGGRPSVAVRGAIVPSPE